MSKPTPVPQLVVCSECGLAWDAHPEDPTKADCIRLLKAELAKRPGTTIVYGYYPAAWPRYVPTWQASPNTTWPGTQIICTGGIGGSGGRDLTFFGGSAGAISSTSATVTFNQPRDDDGPEPMGVAA